MSGSEVEMREVDAGASDQHYGDGGYDDESGHSDDDDDNYDSRSRKRSRADLDAEGDDVEGGHASGARGGQ